jgi:hypothetical protein
MKRTRGTLPSSVKTYQGPSDSTRRAAGLLRASRSDDTMTPLKTCTKCRREYPATSEWFSVDNRRQVGFYSQCRACKRVANSHWQSAHPEVKAHWQETNRDVVRESIIRWAKAHPEAEKARNVARHACDSGRLTCPTICKHCGVRGLLHKHHPDYSKPLDVVVLCPKCHKQVHCQTKEKESRI